MSKVKKKKRKFIERGWVPVETNLKNSEIKEFDVFVKQHILNALQKHFEKSGDSTWEGIKMAKRVIRNL